MRLGAHLFRNRRAMWQMIREMRSGHYRMSLFTLLVLIFAIVYVVFPFDLIPDYIPVIGWIDDIFVLYLLLLRINKEVQRFNRFKAMGRRNGY